MGEDKEERGKEEYNLAVRFMNALERKMNQLRESEIDAERKGGMLGFRLEDAELKALREINNTGLLQGVVAGAITLAVLRRIRAGFTRRVVASDPLARAPPRTSPFQQQKPNPFQQQKPPDTAQPMATAVESSSSNRQRSAGGAAGSFLNILSWMIDGLVSFYVAAFVSLRDPEEILSKLAALPLIEGRSTISDEVCPAFLKELRDMQKEATDTQKEILQNPQTAPLRALLQFCANCQQRAAYEKLLRQQKGLPPNAPVAIPAPGVPQHTDTGAVNPLNISTDYDDAFDDEISHESTNLDDQGDFYDPNQEDSGGSTPPDWTDNFVTDQEEQQKEDKRRRK